MENTQTLNSQKIYFFDYNGTRTTAETWEKISKALAEIKRDGLIPIYSAEVETRFAMKNQRKVGEM